MFVVINSTHTRINKSHLIDLYEKIEWGTDPHKKFSARLVRALYEERDSPLRYRINMLGGRSRQDLWINQAQIYGEVHRFLTRKDAEPWITDGRGLSRDRGYGFLRDVLRAAGPRFGRRPPVAGRNISRPRNPSPHEVAGPGCAGTIRICLPGSSSPVDHGVRAEPFPGSRTTRRPTTAGLAVNALRLQPRFRDTK